MARTDTLGNFLTDVAEAIRTKEGTTETIPASEFDTRIANLSTGSNEPVTNEITSVQELNSAMIDCVIDLFDYYQSRIDNTFNVDTNEPVTLYTPAEGFKYYVIRYRNNQFQALWFNCMFIKERTAPLVQELNTQLIGTMNTYMALKGYAHIPNTLVTASFQDASVNAYLSPTFDTVEEVINALKSSETIYTTATNANWTVQYHSGDNYDSYNSTPYTNMYFMNYQYSLVTKKKISSNEIIEVIPATE